MNNTYKIANSFHKSLCFLENKSEEGDFPIPSQRIDRIKLLIKEMIQNEDKRNGSGALSSDKMIVLHSSLNEELAECLYDVLKASDDEDKPMISNEDILGMIPQGSSFTGTLPQPQEDEGFLPEDRVDAIKTSVEDMLQQAEQENGIVDFDSLYYD